MRLPQVAFASVIVVVAALAAVTQQATRASAATVASVPRPDHVVVVVEENHSASSIIGNAQAPYINSLASSGANFTQMFAETHPSEPNYLALFSGSTQGLTDDSCPHTYSAANLGSELIAAGLSFAGYSEGLPSVGSTACFNGKYARKHNPWSDFSNVPTTANQPLTAFPSDYSQLPNVSIVVPNLDNDMHDGTIAQGDTWLQNNLGAYATWAATHNSLLIVTWDEDDGSQSNQVPTIIAGQGVIAGNYSEQVNHYNLLRTLTDAFGLAPLGLAATAAPILDIWSGGGDAPPTAAFTTNCTQLTCTFDATGSTDSDGTITDYHWDFGDGTTGSGVTTTHAYAVSGQYAPSLTVTDNAMLTNTVSHPVSIGGILASDTFSRAVTNGWGSASTGGAWSVSPTASFSVANGTGQVVAATAGAQPTAVLGAVSATSVDVLLDVSVDKPPTGDMDYVNVLVRHTATQDYRLKLKLVAGGTVRLAVSKVVASKETSLKDLVVPNLTYTAGSTLRLRFDAIASGSSTTLTGVVWAPGTNEPAPQLTQSDADPALQGTGSVAVQSRLGSAATNAPVTFTYDNVVVTDKAVNTAPTAAFSVTCTNLSCSVDASASSDAQGPIAAYSWTFGDGSTGTGVTATHAYAAAGSYSVVLTVTDSGGLTGSTAHTANPTSPPVNQPPVAAFAASCTGLSCTFDASASYDPDGSIASYDWDFGDGSTGSGNTAPHAYAQAGSYVVSLTVTDGLDATDTVTQTVDVQHTTQPPVANFTWQCTNLSCSFDASTSTDPDGTITAYSWDFGDNSTATGQTTSHTFGAAGSFTVTLTVTDNDSLTGTTTNTVTVTAPPVAYASDTFTRTVANGWGTADLGGAWTLSGSATNYAVAGGVGSAKVAKAASQLTALLNGVSVTDLDEVVDVRTDRVPTGDYAVAMLLARRSGTNDYRLKLKLLPGGTVQLSRSKVVLGVETSLGQVTIANLTWSAGDVLRMRFDLHTLSGSTHITGTVWKVATTEPQPQVTTNDSDPTLQSPGAVGVITSLNTNVTNAPITFGIDNFLVGAPLN
jgi:PKD repeat protein